MKLFSFTLLLSFTCLVLKAEQYPRNREIGIMPGISYYMGDLNPEGHLTHRSLFHLAGALYFKNNYNPRWSQRFMIMRGTLSGDDDFLFGSYPQWRNLNFRSSVTEVSTTIEFNFLEFSYVESRSQWGTPYLFAGIAGFYFNPKGTINGRELDLQSQLHELKEYSKISFAIPFGVGAKVRLGDRVAMGIEYGMRKTFTDYIDDVSTVFNDSPYQRGDSQQNDWYQFAGISFSLRVGSKFTNCHFDGHRVVRKKMNDKESKKAKKRRTKYNQEDKVKN